MELRLPAEVHSDRKPRVPEPSLANYKGSFTVTSGHSIDVLFHWSGLEEYKVDGKVALTSRAWEYAGVRDFRAGEQSIRVRYSLIRLYCKAYVNGKLVVRDVFPRLRERRDKLRQVRRSPHGQNPAWVTFVFWMLLAYIIVGTYGQVFG